MAASPEQDLPTTTKLAVERTRLAHERTLMAWVRTATSLISSDLLSTSSSSTCGSRRVRPRAGPSGHGGWGADDSNSDSVTHPRHSQSPAQHARVRADYGGLIPYSLSTILAGRSGSSRASFCLVALLLRM